MRTLLKFAGKELFSHNFRLSLAKHGHCVDNLWHPDIVLRLRLVVFVD